MYKILERLNSAQLFLAFSALPLILIYLCYPLILRLEPIDLYGRMIPSPVNLYSVFLLILLLCLSYRDMRRVAGVDRFRLFMLSLLVMGAASLLTGYSIPFLILFSFFSYVYAYKRKSFRKPLWIFWVLWAYYAVQITGLIGSPDLREALHIIKSQIPFLIIPLAFCAYRPSRRELRFLATVLLRFALGFLLILILNYLLLSYTFDSPPWAAFSFDKFYFKIPYHRPSPNILMLEWVHFKHSSYVYMVLQTIMIVAFIQHRWLVKRGVSRSRFDIRAFELILLQLGILIFAFITQSRIAMLMFLVGLSAWLVLELYLRRSKFTYVAVGIIAAMAILIAPRMLNSSFMRDVDREIMRERTFLSLEQHPLFGSRLGSASSMLQPFVLDGQHRHPHNQLLAELLHFGWPGLAVFLLLMGSISYFGWKRKNYALMAYAFVLLALMMIESPLTFSRGAYISVFWICFLAQVPASAWDPEFEDQEALPA